MSHWPGPALENWVTDWYRVVDVDGDVATGWRRMYGGQHMLTVDQLAQLVVIHEPIRKHVEWLLSRYDEDECGSWRDYCSNFDVPAEISEAARTLLESFQAEQTKPFEDRTGLYQ